jgi:hypothetical protein
MDLDENFAARTDTKPAWQEYHDRTQEWQGWFESRLQQERVHTQALIAHEHEYTRALLEEVLRGLSDESQHRLDEALAGVRPQRSLTVCGTYDPTVRYRALDVVANNGASFAARRDDPGRCPGDDWQMIAAQGKKGPPGSPGTNGRDGVDAPVIRGWEIDSETYVATPIMSNGRSGPTLNLRPLFEKFLVEIGE